MSTTNEKLAQEPINQPEDFERLAPGDQESLRAWIRRSLKPTQSTKNTLSSYHLKHVYENTAHKYVTNGQFKGAMQAEGYQHVDGLVNWNYKVKVIIAEE